jgi:hypothetical protein
MKTPSLNDALFHLADITCVTLRLFHAVRGAISLAPWLQPGDQKLTSNPEPFERFLVVAIKTVKTVSFSKFSFQVTALK